MKPHEHNDPRYELYDKVRDYFRKNRKLTTQDWLNFVEDPSVEESIYEVGFKNTRKAFYKNTSQIPLKAGDIVAVEGAPGHDIGVVTLTGLLARKQFRRKIKNKENYYFLDIYRKVNLADMRKFLAAKENEIAVRNRARQIVQQMKLEMKVSDVEIQGDYSKAIFYYLADGRVDFRELIKVLAGEFKLKIEMRQIGARQEAAMIGGLELSGREFCGSTWKTEFESVRSYAVKIQQLHINDPKLLDHSGNLKVSLLYELDNYREAWKSFPKEIPPIETTSGTYYPHKMEILQKMVWFSSSKDHFVNPVKVPVERVKSIMNLNQRDIKPSLGGDEFTHTDSQSFSIGSTDFSDLKQKGTKKSKNKRKKGRNKSRGSRSFQS